MSKTIKLFGSTKIKINKDKNGENLPQLVIFEKIFVHCNIVNNDYWQELRILYTFAPNKNLANY